MQLDIESLRVLLAVLDHGGMTRAAQHLNIGQSAVSRKVQRLERDLPTEPWDVPLHVFCSPRGIEFFD